MNIANLKGSDNLLPPTILEELFIKFIFIYNYGTPFLVPGLGQFSNANIFVLDQHIAEFKTDLKSSTIPLLSPILHYNIRRPNKELFTFEN